ncbi:unnamed protein product [Pylaiella littoralis]
MVAVNASNRQRRRRLRGWICPILGAGLSIGLPLLGRVDGFNPPPLLLLGGRLSLEQNQRTQRGLELPSSAYYSTQRQERRCSEAGAWEASRRDRGVRAGGLGDAATGHEQLNGGYAMDEGWMGNNWTAGDRQGAGDGGGVASGSGMVTGAIATAAAKESMEAAAKQAVPLKVMVFIDGTWLYYSFFGRGERCHVSAKLGPGWVYDYKVKWEMLPVIISRAVHAQLAQYSQSSRLVEVVRTVVFSSARKDTDKDSNRMQMFNAMREKNFEVHMATTMGVQEKCIDIALAVEMMHYATIPDTYDIGVLVTGDKDFMPAMARTRQKGRRVCLCSMRNSCNQDLLRDDAHVMDFEPVWINEYLDDLMEYSPRSESVGASNIKVAPEVLCQLVIKLMDQKGGSIMSRELGRELNKIKVDKDGTKALSVIKETWQSLSKFLLEHNDVFQIGKIRLDPNDPTANQFRISKVASQNSMKSLKLGEVMDESESESEGDSDDAAYSQHDDGDDDDDDDDDDVDEGEEEESAWDAEAERETEKSLSLELVPQLKQRLRDRGLPVSGKKADLITRLLESMAADAFPPPPPHSPPARRLTTARQSSASAAPAPAAAAAAAAAAAEAAAGGRLGHDADTAGGGGLVGGWAAAAAEALIAGDPSSVVRGMPGGGGGGGSGSDSGSSGKTMGNRAEARRGGGVSAAAAAYGGFEGRPGAAEGEEEARNRRIDGYAALVSIVSGALENSPDDGVVSSRALGRELSRLPSPENPSETALMCLKSRWPSLMAFLKACPSDFTVTDIGKSKEFGVVKNDRGGGGGWEGGGGGGGGGGRFEESRHGVGRSRTVVARAAAVVNGGDGRHDRSRRGG